MPTLVMLHCEVNTGYAIAQHEGVFYDAACQVEGGADGVHFSYRRIGEERPTTLPLGFANLVEYDFKLNPPAHRLHMSDYAREHRIQKVLAFDLSPGNPVHGVLRGAGVHRIIAYHGAPMGTPGSSLRLMVKRLQLRFQEQADHYVFQSKAMQESGIRGRGLDPTETSVVRSGMDTDAYKPGLAGKSVLRERLGIPTDRFVVFYSGHMERRKGVWVIIEAAKHLVDELGVRDVHFLICGNRPGEEQAYLEMMAGAESQGHVTFAGYRNDIPELMSASDMATIATTGWDSFPRSTMEMASSGLPLVVSDIGGLPEAVEHGRTGFVVPAAKHEALAQRILELKADDELRREMGRAGRDMAIRRYARSRQVDELAQIIRGERAGEA